MPVNTMENRYWVDDDKTGNANSGNNWSESSGGAGGAGVPNRNHNVVFDGGGIADCFVTAEIECQNIIFHSGYTGTIHGANFRFMPIQNCTVIT